MKENTKSTSEKRSPLVAFLDLVEWVGNKLPDPAVLFILGILLIWVLSAGFSSMKFTEKLPGKDTPIQIVNLLTPEKFADFLSKMTETFVGFHPLGVVLVAMLGVGVAEHSGFINAVLKTMLSFTPKPLLTPIRRPCASMCRRSPCKAAACTPPSSCRRGTSACCWKGWT